MNNVSDQSCNTVTVKLSELWGKFERLRDIRNELVEQFRLAGDDSLWQVNEVKPNAGEANSALPAELRIVEPGQWGLSSEDAHALVLDPIESELYQLAWIAAETTGPSTAEAQAVKANILMEYSEDRAGDIVHALARSLAGDCGGKVPELV